MMNNFQENNERRNLKARLEQARLLLQKQKMRTAEIQAEISEILAELHQAETKDDDWEEEDDDWGGDAVWDDDPEWGEEF